MTRSETTKRARRTVAPTPTRDPLVFVAVRIPRTLVDRLDGVVARRTATARANPPRRSDLVREALAVGLDAIERGDG